MKFVRPHSLISKDLPQDLLQWLYCTCPSYIRVYIVPLKTFGSDMNDPRLAHDLRVARVAEYLAIPGTRAFGATPRIAC